MKKGKISVKAENILPIIKKWLYSDKDIFLREVVSNSSDAIFKLERLISIGEAQKQDGNEKYEIKVTVNKGKNTLSISDNGIGMTEQEVKDYIAQVAFSGAVDFVEKYKEQTSGEGIIGHFGLGFYSVFMVADTVEIDTMSYKEESVPVKWICDGGSSYQIGEGERTQRGTTLTLHVSEDSKEFLDEYKVREILRKYCAFISYEIIVEDENKEKKEDEAPAPVNTTKPLWMKPVKECTDEEYKQFYKEVFHDFMDPLFWIHLNVDSPFQLKAIIYFPKLRDDVSLMDMGEIKLYYNQVFVADNIKEILPEFLMVLKGVIDSPDIPVNVSRSFLQNDGSVTQIANFIAKKISDKLHSIYNDSREDYTKYWDDIQVLIKYGCIRDSKFFDRMKDVILLKTSDEEYLTVNEYLEGSGDSENKVIYYTDNKAQQAANIEMYKSNGLCVAELSHPIDIRFMQELEMKQQGLRFVCVTAELPDNLTSGQVVSEEDATTLSDLFSEALANDKLEVRAEYLKDDKIPALLTLSEQSKRYQEMSKNFGGMPFAMNMGEEFSMTVNRSNPLIEKILTSKSEDKKEVVQALCKQIYDIALMSHRELNNGEKESFIQRSYMLFDLIV